MAYKLLTQTTYPSWGYMLSIGATTIWERWSKVEVDPLSSLVWSRGSLFYTFLADPTLGG